MLEAGTIPMTDEERGGVTELLAKHPGKAASLTRNQPDETGLVRVDVEGAGVWLVDEHGKATKAAS